MEYSTTMVREDRGRFQNGKPLINKDKVFKMARSQEDYLVALEAEMRAAGQMLDELMMMLNYFRS